MKRFIKANKSIIVAADVPGKKSLIRLAKATAGVDGVGGFKFGITQGLNGLAEAIDSVKNIEGHENTSIIYDHQKAGNDIPDMGAKFARTLRKAGVDVAILFPFTGPATQEAWTRACIDEGLQVMTGGIMTHPQFLVSEGGYIDDDAPLQIYRLACDLGVEHFVVPGNKPDWVTRIRGVLEDNIGVGNFSLSAPGFITQGGDISECGRIAGDIFYPIVGGGIYNHKTKSEMKTAACKLAKGLLF